MMGLPDVATLLARLEEQRAFVAAQFDEIFSDKSAAPATTATPTRRAPAAPTSDNQEAIAARLAAPGLRRPARRRRAA